MNNLALSDAHLLLPQIIEWIPEAVSFLVEPTLPGELALVVSRQRELDAFVLIGRRRDGSVLRADEVAALRGTLQLVGVEWQALRWDALQREHGRPKAPPLVTSEHRADPGP